MGWRRTFLSASSGSTIRLDMPTFLQRVLASAARTAIRRERPTVVAVAGSVGKTSTRQATAIALGGMGMGSGVRLPAKNFNNEWGVPFTVFGATDYPRRSPVRWAWMLGRAFALWTGLGKIGARTLVLEMGTDKPGDLDYLLSIATPTVGVITAIGAEHTEFFGSLEGVAQEEGTMFRALKPGATAIRNADDDWSNQLPIPEGVRVISFGRSEGATVRILGHEVVLDPEHPEAAGLRIRLAIEGMEKEVRIRQAIGRSQAYAVAASLAVCRALGADLDLAVRRLEGSYAGLPGRTRLLPGIRRTWLIDDSYNASPLAMRAALDDLAAFPVAPGDQRIAVLGHMRELGPLEEAEHVHLGRYVAEKGVDRLIVCDKLARVVADAAIEAGMPEEKVSTFPTAAEAGRFAQDKMRQGDVVLLKGSRGVHLEVAVQELMDHPERAKDLLVAAH